METRIWDRVAFVFGRILIGGMFIYSALSNVVGLQGAAGYAASKGLGAPVVLVLLAMFMLLAAGISIITGFRPQFGIGAAVLFLLPVTLIMHNFWALDGMQRVNALHSFQGNVGLVGAALMFLAIPRPWPFSFDQRLDLTSRNEQKTNPSRFERQLRQR
ncbi:MAG: hypothetical protein NVS2B7_12180 [Herpetosiphon sp.]